MTVSIDSALDDADTQPRLVSRGSAIRRIFFLAALALAHAALISFFYDPPINSHPQNLAIAFIWDFAGNALHAVMLVVAAFAILNWPKRMLLLQDWRSSLTDHRFGIWLSVNLVTLLVTIVASIVVSSSLEIYGQLIGPYFILLGVLGLTFMLAVAPVGFWRQLLSSTWVSILFSVLVAALVLAISLLSQSGWVPLAGATLNLSYGLMSLYEHDVVLNIATQQLGVGDFIVIIGPECSGYEGIGLVATVLSLYLYVFRSELAFPNALLLLPIGAVAIWLFNAVRIAALVSLGAHVSPHIAVGGFHSQAGWIAFLIVTVGIMVLGHKVAFFHRKDAVAAPAVPRKARALGSAATDDALTWLAPFMGLMLASIIASAFAPNDQWLYGLRVIAIGWALWMFRDFYRSIAERVEPISLVAGLAVGVAWIATDPDPATGAALGDWLATLPAWALVLWLAVRAAGTILFVPIAEEMAFRGFLHRAIASQRFAGAGPVVMMLVAFVVTSLLFGAIHQRWLAGALAGAVYALVMYRTGRMSDPIAAHMASNAVIFAWAVAFSQWSLL